MRGLALMTVACVAGALIITEGRLTLCGWAYVAIYVALTGWFCLRSWQAEHLGDERSDDEASSPAAKCD
jgi:hypothetical protein